MREMARVTKPGGIVCVATEILLRDDQSHPEFFTRSEFNRYILRASSDLALVDKMKWRFPSKEYVDDPVILWEEVHRLRRHVVLQEGDYQWTSAIAFLRKGRRNWTDLLRVLWPSNSFGPGARPEEAPKPYSTAYRIIHNDARCEAAGASLNVTTPDQPWSYAIEMPLQDRVPEGHALKIKISVHVRDKSARFGVLKPNGEAFIQEIEVAQNTEAKSVELAIPANTPVGSLMVRTGASGPSEAQFEIQSCEF
jgi:hypothetical protein